MNCRRTIPSYARPETIPGNEIDGDEGHFKQHTAHGARFFYLHDRTYNMQTRGDHLGRVIIEEPIGIVGGLRSLLNGFMGNAESRAYQRLERRAFQTKDRTLPEVTALVLYRGRGTYEDVEGNKNNRPIFLLIADLYDREQYSSSERVD